MIKRLLKNKVEFSLHFCASHAHLLYYYPSSFDAPQVLPAHVITHHHYYLLLTIINHLCSDLTWRLLEHYFSWVLILDSVKKISLLKILGYFWFPKEIFDANFELLHKLQEASRARPGQVGVPSNSAFTKQWQGSREKSALEVRRDIIFNRFPMLHKEKREREESLCPVILYPKYLVGIDRNPILYFWPKLNQKRDAVIETRK